MNLPDNVAAHWDHFQRVDIPAAAPYEQRHEMKRAFLAGLSSGIVIALNLAKANGSQYEALARRLCDLMTEVSAMDAVRRADFNSRSQVAPLNHNERK